MKINVLDLFSGCGGLSYGFHLNPNYNIVVANDIWDKAQATYTENFKQTPFVLGDITNNSVKQSIYHYFNQSNCDLIIGGPPCQAYSLSGKRDLTDKRATLFNDYLEIVQKLNPSICLMENVKGILSSKYLGDDQHPMGSKVIDVITDKFKKLGYIVDYKVLNSVIYNVPQKRERVIIIATKNIPIRFPEPVNPLNPITVEDAIDDLKNLPENTRFSHTFTKHSSQVVERIKNTQPGFSILPKYKECYYKCKPNKPSNTVKEHHGSVFLHYEKDRVMTPRELARLQTFPDQFIFKGTKSSILTQIGNAVPVNLSIVLANTITELLKGTNTQ